MGHIPTPNHNQLSITEKQCEAPSHRYGLLKLITGEEIMPHLPVPLEDGTAIADTNIYQTQLAAVTAARKEAKQR